MRKPSGGTSSQNAWPGRRGEGALRGPRLPRARRVWAPVAPANFDGPGAWPFLCLDHVREHNAKYNYFNGMSPEEITEAQSPIADGNARRASSPMPARPAPSWSDFADPLDAISARFRRARRSASRFNRAEQRALSVLGLGEDADLKAVRSSYSKLVRRFHPDRNGGDRSHERPARRGHRSLSAAPKIDRVHLISKPMQRWSV